MSQVLQKIYPFKLLLNFYPGLRSTLPTLFCTTHQVPSIREKGQLGRSLTGQPVECREGLTEPCDALESAIRILRQTIALPIAKFKIIETGITPDMQFLCGEHNTNARHRAFPRPKQQLSI